MTITKTEGIPVLDPKRTRPRPLFATAVLIIAFAAFFLGMGLYLDGVRAVVSRKQFSTHEFGPLKIERPLEAITFKLSHLPPPDSWTYIETIVSKNDGKVLFSFGEEFYHESAESISFKDTSATKLFLPGNDEYTFNFYTESAKVKDSGSGAKPVRAIIDATVEFHRGDSYWHYRVGLMLLVAGTALFFMWRFIPFSGFRFTVIAAVILIAGFTALTSAALTGLDLETDPGPAWGTVKANAEFIESPSLREGSLGGPDHLGGSLMGGK